MLFLFFSELVDARISVALIWKFSSLKTKSLLSFVNDSTCSLWVWSIECGRLNSFEKCSFHSSAEIGFSLCEASIFRNFFRVSQKALGLEFCKLLSLSHTIPKLFILMDKVVINMIVSYSTSQVEQVIFHVLACLVEPQFLPYLFLFSFYSLFYVEFGCLHSGWLFLSL